MARIRTVKPEMAQNEDLAGCSAWAQLLAVRLLNQADDEGYFKAHPSLIKASCFPLVEDPTLDTTVALRELYCIGFVALYDGSDGKQYGHIVKFLEHQVVNKPTPSKIKDLCALPSDYCTTTVGLPIGKERKGKERKGDAPSDSDESSGPVFMEIQTNNGKKYPVGEGLVSEWIELYPAVDVRQEIRNAKGWTEASPSRRKTYGGMKRFLNGWLTRCQNRGGNRSNGADPNAEFK